MSGFCLGCMKPKAGNPVCEHCGFDERQGNLSHQLPLGTVLQNQYLVGKVLGQGGFGITYMGWDRNLSVPVAIKEYYPGGVVQRNTQWGTDVSCANGKSAEAYGRYRDRFLKEARTLAQLARIPEIVQIRSYFQENNTAYIVMEYVQGITLKSCLNNLGRPMTEAEALEIMQPVLKALQKIHHCGVIHRDISPDNIMIHNSGIKLIDFGTVRYIDDSGHSQSTEAILKPGFAPMEQYNTRGNLGTWTDVYAICASFHYLLTGKVPPDVHERLDEGEELTLLRNRGEISGNTVKALEKGMRIRYQERLQTVDELYSLLYAPKPVKQQKQKKEKTAKVKKPAPKKRRKGIGAIAVAAVAVAAACALILQPKQTKTEPGLIAPEPVVSEEAERNTPEAIAYAEAEQLLAKGETGKAAIAFGKLGDYKDARARSFNLWNTLIKRESIYCINGYFYGLKNDGSVVTAGEDGFGISKNSDWKDVLQLVGGSDFGYLYQPDTCLLGLRSDGTVITAGQNEAGQCDVSDWTDVVKLWHQGARFFDSTKKNGFLHYDYHNYEGMTVGLRADGTVLTTGSLENAFDVAGWTDIVDLEISCSWDEQEHIMRGGLLVGVRSDGTVVFTGNVIENWMQEMETWTDIVDVCTGGVIIGLRSDGTVVYASDNNSQYEYMKTWENVSVLINIRTALSEDGNLLSNTHAPRGSMKDQWNNLVYVNDRVDIGLKADGTVVVDAFDSAPNGKVRNWTDVVAVSGWSGNHGGHTIGIRSDGKVLVVGDTKYIGEVASWTDIKLPDALLLSSGQEETIPEETPTDMQARYDAAENLLAQGETAKAAIAFGKLGDYQDARQRSFRLWRELTPNQTVCGAYHITAALQENGTVLFAGSGDARQMAAKKWTDIISVSISSNHSVGLKADGTVVAAGANFLGQCDVSQWKDIIAICASGHTVGLRSDGTVVAIGYNENEACNVSDWKDIVAISASNHTVGLKMDGTVVAVGAKGFDHGQLNVSDWTDIIAISAGNDHTVGLKSDGTVVAVGADYGKNGVSECVTDVKGWTDIIAVAAGSGFTAGLKSDGTVVFAGFDCDQNYKVSEWSDIVSISAGCYQLFGQKADGTLVATGLNKGKGELNVTNWTDIKLPN